MFCDYLIYSSAMLTTDNIADWFWVMRNHAGPKLVTGRRGIGKSKQLTMFAERLLAAGVPQKEIIVLDGESPQAYRLLSCKQIVEFIIGSSRNMETCHVLIREGDLLPDIGTVLGTLDAMPRFNVFVTASSRHMITAGLADYLGNRLAYCECLPPILDEPSADIRRIWREALLYDVHTPVRQPLNAQILNALACHLSDSTGDPLSLRSIAAAISPGGNLLSPHTIDSYLTALSDAHLIARCQRYDLAEECVLKSQYRCYFTSPAFRTELFGPAPSNEARRARLNAAWLKLSHESDAVFAASSAPEHVDFVTRQGSCYRLWHVHEDGITEISRASFVAG